jgi:hypothetical protein
MIGPGADTHTRSFDGAVPSAPPTMQMAFKRMAPFKGMCSSSSGSSSSLLRGIAVGVVRSAHGLNTFLQLPSTASFRQVTCNSGMIRTAAVA